MINIFKSLKKDENKINEKYFMIYGNHRGADSVSSRLIILDNNRKENVFNPYVNDEKIKKIYDEMNRYYVKERLSDKYHLSTGLFKFEENEDISPGNSLFFFKEDEALYLGIGLVTAHERIGTNCIIYTKFDIKENGEIKVDKNMLQYMEDKLEFFWRGKANYERPSFIEETLSGYNSNIQLLKEYINKLLGLDERELNLRREMPLKKMKIKPKDAYLLYKLMIDEIIPNYTVKELSKINFTTFADKPRQFDFFISPFKRSLYEYPYRYYSYYSGIYLDLQTI